jgi:DNA-directed RNA polymerase subunit K/omega
MRSEYVFAAAKEISNRFLLCRMASVSARRMQIGSKQSSDTINRSLLLIAAAELSQPPSEAVIDASQPVLAVEAVMS